jgi:hypothetical protein
MPYPHKEIKRKHNPLLSSPWCDKGAAERGADEEEVKILKIAQIAQ